MALLAVVSSVAGLACLLATAFSATSTSTTAVRCRLSMPASWPLPVRSASVTRRTKWWMKPARTMRPKHRQRAASYVTRTPTKPSRSSFIVSLRSCCSTASASALSCAMIDSRRLQYTSCRANRPCRISTLKPASCITALATTPCCRIKTHSWRRRETSSTSANTPRATR